MTYNETREKDGWFGPLRHMGIYIPMATDPAFHGWLIGKQAELGLVADGVLGLGTSMALQKAHLGAGRMAPSFSADEMQDGHSECPAEYLPNLYFTAACAQVIRDRVYGSSPCGIVSGYRSPAMNEACGGAKASKHMLGQAIDIRPQGAALSVPQLNYAATLLHNLMKEGVLPWGALIGYPTKSRPWLHWDHRGSYYHKDVVIG